MKRTIVPFALSSLLIVVGCTGQGTEPQAQAPVTVEALWRASAVRADPLTLNYVSVATGVDDGPQDGIFDSFTIPNLGSVNNNGFTSFRTAFEFSLTDVPVGATIRSAELTVVLSNYEGTRAIEAHGYAGDGTVELADFARNGLVGSASVGVGVTQTLHFDVTTFVADLVANGEGFAGFNVREAPANTANFLVMFLDLGGAPVLSIDLSTEQAVDIDIQPGGVPNSINLRSKGKIPVAILSTPTFDAPREVAGTTLTFGPTGGEPSLAFCNATAEDVNGDGLPDMICHFSTQATGFQPADRQGVLKGQTLGGVAIKGTDTVRIIP